MAVQDSTNEDDTDSDNQQQQISQTLLQLQHDQDDLHLNHLRIAIEEQETTHQSNGSVDENLQKHYISSIDTTLLTRLLPSQGLSFQLWPAATTLVNLLDHHLNETNTTPISNFFANRPSKCNLRILELGSGTGLVGIAAAAILGANVTLTDLPHVLPNLRFNAALNSNAIASRGGCVDVASLRWGEAEDVKGLTSGGPFDVVLGSDVVYYDELFEPLIKTLCWLLREGERSDGVFLMAHLKRWKKEAVFFRKARKLFSVEKIHSDPPLQGSRNGVVVYSFACKK